MESRISKEENIAHCIILPFPNQGHINPMLQFAKRLTHKHLKITFTVTKFLFSKEFSGGGSISVRTISDGFDEGGRSQAQTFEEYQTRFQRVGHQTLTELISDLNNSGCPVDCIIYDSFITWALDLAKGLGLYAAAFFTQSCAVDVIYYRFFKGELKLPLPENEVAVVIEGLPVELKPEELPSFIYNYGSYPVTFQMISDQFQNIHKMDWIFVNTFYKLEKEVIDMISRVLQFKAIGPTIPSMYLDNRIQEDTDYGLNILKPLTDICISWLNQQPPKSVIYISVGSLAKLSLEQTQELAYALRTCNRPFLWVIRSSEEEDKLPLNFSEDALNKGLIVSWSPQLQVLSHESIGCFVTHCGWNSILEGLSLGVPMVAMPQWTDQSTNAKFVVDVWKIGIKARVDDNGLVMQEEIIRCLNFVMEGANGERIRMSAAKWKVMAKEAVEEGGSSDNNIEEFVSTLKSHLEKRKENDKIFIIQTY